MKWPHVFAFPYTHPVISGYPNKFFFSMYVSHLFQRLRNWMQRVRMSTRLAVYFAVCFLLAGLATIIVVNMVMRQQALDEARDKARIILDHNLAIHTYFTHQLKPHYKTQFSLVCKNSILGQSSIVRSRR